MKTRIRNSSVNKVEGTISSIRVDLDRFISETRHPTIDEATITALGNSVEYRLRKLDGEITALLPASGTRKAYVDEIAVMEGVVGDLLHQRYSKARLALPSLSR